MFRSLKGWSCFHTAGTFAIPLRLHLRQLLLLLVLFARDVPGVLGLARLVIPIAGRRGLLLLLLLLQVLVPLIFLLHPLQHLLLGRRLLLPPRWGWALATPAEIQKPRA